jgi:hypothetical protein
MNAMLRTPAIGTTSYVQDELLFLGNKKLGFKQPLPLVAVLSVLVEAALLLGPL